MNSTVLQWNINGLHPQREHLQLWIKELNPAVICLQETNFKSNLFAELPHYDIIFKNRQNPDYASGGVTTYINKNFSWKQVPINTNIEAIAARIILKTGQITICNVYLPNSKPLSLEKLSDLIKQLPKPFIILGDFNSHNPLWGSKKSDNRGKIIEKWIEHNDLFLLNNMQPTHFNSSYRSFSNIDLSLCNPSIAPTISRWTNKDLQGSDHFPIQLLIHPTSVEPRTPCSTKWRLDKADWTGFNRYIDDKINSQQFSNNYKNNNINNKMDTFTNLILEAARESIPVTAQKPHKKQVPWWNEKYNIAIHKSKHAFYVFKRHPTTDNLINYKKQRAITRKTLKEARRESWTNFIANII